MKKTFYYLILIHCICLTVVTASRSQDRKLIELRKDFANRYLQPEAHFALAKYYIDQGNFVQAFFILEYARRYRFEKKDFDEAYIKFFGDPMPEPPIEAKDAFATASKLVTEQKYDEAEIYFQKTNKIYDKSFFINAWIGRFYYKTRADSSKALPYYFKAYFLYPHAYETEYAEYRIRAIVVADAKNVFTNYLSNKKQLSELARDENPLIVSMAIEQMGKEWKPEFVPILLEVMGNDDSMVRWGAFVTLSKFSGPSLDKSIDELLTDSDLRKRGLAAYAIVERQGEEKFQILRKMLADPAELIRFDAVSALVLRGGLTGKQILQEHQPIERQPRLKSLIVSALKRLTN